MTAFLSLENLSKTYGTHIALNGMSLNVSEGEFVSFLGPSGCGKTTTLRMIGGFVQPDSGAIRFQGIDLAGVPPYKRRAINTVFQDYALFPHLTVAENVAFGLRYAGMAKDKRDRVVDESLATVGLSARRDYFPGVLSGGQKQRVALARAICLRPKILLLDEPLSALDAKLREEMQIELKRLHRQLGIAFVFVTHSQDEALVMSDRIILMRDGRIEQEGTPEDLYTRPTTLFAAEFIGNRALATGTVLHREGLAGTVSLGGIEIPTCWTDPAARDGEPVRVLLSPEHLSLTGNGGIQAQVTDILFLGQVRRILLKLASGETVMMDRKAHDTTALPSIGETVSFSVAPNTVRAYCAAGARP